MDRDSDIWLRNFYTESDHTAPMGDYAGVSPWIQYWKWVLMQIEVKHLETGGRDG